MRRAMHGGLIVSLLAMTVLTASTASAQTVNHGNVEITVMNGLGIVTANGDDATVIITPVPPVWRASVWTESALTLDLGFSFLSAHEDYDDLTIINAEAGPGVNLAPRDASLVPFVGGLGGLLYADNGSSSNTSFYVGGQVGIRSFIRDYAAVRMQVGYRHVMEEGEDIGIIEIVGGLSFFL